MKKTNKNTSKPTYWRYNQDSGKLERQDRLTSGFVLDDVDYEKKPWISWLMAPMVNTLTAYVWLKKKWWNRFKGKNPPVNTMWFDGLGKYSKVCKEGHGNWESLKVLYVSHKQKKYTISWFIDQMGFYNVNAQSVRNRLRTTKTLLEQYTANRMNKQILCLACGSAESILPSIQNIQSNNHFLTLIDNDSDVIDYLEKEHSCSQKDFIRISHMDIHKFFDENKKTYDFVEMIGILEYLENTNASEIIAKCTSILNPGGIFVTSNIKRNSESNNVKWMLGWNMNYRTLEQFFGILKGGGGLDGLEIVTEPLGIHNIAIIRKNSGEKR